MQRAIHRGGLVPGRTARGEDAALDEAEPLLVTAWGEFIVRGGVLFVPFKCGATKYMLAMGPEMALDAIELAQRVLSTIHRNNLASMAEARRKKII